MSKTYENVAEVTLALASGAVTAQEAQVLIEGFLKDMKPKGGGKPKTACPLTRAEFAEHATAIEVVVNGVELTADPKQFSSGGFGYYLGGKITVKVNGKPVTCQLGLNLVAVNSKDAAD